jgi:hypothetical protein
MPLLSERERLQRTMRNLLEAPLLPPEPTFPFFPRTFPPFALSDILWAPSVLLLAKDFLENLGHESRISS